MFDDAIQLLLNSSLHKDTIQIERCKLVLSRIRDLFTVHDETVKDMGNTFTDIISSCILASTLKHVSCTSDASTPVGIVHYNGQNDSTEQSFKILPCNEILKLVKDRISSGNSEGMTSIQTKNGHLICPSFNVQGSPVLKKKVMKLERRKVRLKQFETVSDVMLSFQSFQLSNIMEDSDVAKWAVNYLDMIKSLPLHQNKKQELQTQSKAPSLQQCGPRNQQITNSNDKPEADGNSDQVMQAEDVSKMILDIHSSMGNLENKSVEPANITPNNSKPILGHNSVGNPVSELQNSNNVPDKIQTEEELAIIIAKRKEVNRKRNERRRGNKANKGSLENQSVAAANITPNNSKAIIGHNSVGNPASELQNSNSVSDKIQTEEHLIEIAKKEARIEVIRKRSERRQKKKRLFEQMQKCETPSSQPAKQARITDNTGITGDVNIRVTPHWRSTNQAVLVEGAHYVCWFDSANSLFCYRRLLQTPDSVQKTRHIPYQAFKVNHSDTAESPLIRIPLEIPTMNEKQRLFMAELKQSCVANTLPPPTNATPTWNPVYESLYIMKTNWSKPLQEGHIYRLGRYMLSEVDIWKYPLKGFSKLSLQLRTPS